MTNLFRASGTTPVEDSMHFRFAAAALAAISCVIAPVAAQDDAVVITATRSEQRVRDAIAHATVITEREIRDSGAADLPSLLRRVAGFEYTQNGGIGTTSTTLLRGATTNQILVLIDGVRVSSATTGTTQLDQLMPDQIERVEVVRGPVSSLYGSGAIGGVIQIFTRQGRGAPRLEVDASAGGYGSQRLRASYSGELGDTRFAATVSRLETDGFSSIRPDVVPGANPDRDGYRNTSLSASLSHRLARGHEAGLRLFSSDGRVEFDNAFAAAASDRHRGTTAVSSSLLYLNNQLASRWLSRLSLSEGRDRFDNFTNDNVTSRTRTRNTQLAWHNDVSLAPEHTVTLGVESLRQAVSSTTNYVRSGRDVDALLAGYVGRSGRHGLQFNLRDERYSDFGRARTHFAGYGFDLTPQWRLIGSASRAFRAPTFNELFFPGFGNATLRPERSRNAELGLQFASGSHLARAVAFRSRIVDLINPFPIVNINEAAIDGLELAYAGRLGGFDLRASLSLQDPVQRTAAAETQLIRRAKHFGNFSLGRSWGQWRFAAEYSASGRRFDNHVTAFPTTRVELRRYDLFNLVSEYRIVEGTVAYARLENAFDRDYVLTHGFNTQGRKLSLGIRHQF
ncbi:MAG: TonB-dependent receptor [Betaproteobacteria bacterium]|nr:TonB-dependent receptor [Betaproteobacteria bacterium]